MKYLGVVNILHAVDSSPSSHSLENQEKKSQRGVKLTQGGSSGGATGTLAPIEI